jgi:hypothetical protein
MKKIVWAIGLLMLGASVVGAAVPSQEQIKKIVLEAVDSYPYVRMVYEAKSMPDEFLEELVSSKVCWYCSGEYEKSFLSIIRSLTPAELEGMETKFEEKERSEDQELRNWHSPEADALRKKEREEYELENKRWEEEHAQREKQYKQDQEEIERQARAPEVVAAVNGFVNALHAESVKKAANQFCQVFIAQWKKGIPVPEKPGLEKIFDTLVLTIPAYQKTNKKGHYIVFPERNSEEEWHEYRALSDEIEKIQEPVRAIMWPYRNALYGLMFSVFDGKGLLPVIRDSLQVVVQELKAQGVK